MRWVWCCIFLLMSGIAWASNDLSVAIENVRTACGGIGAELNDMKTMAGINTAVTGVGTVAGGVALGTGLAKTKVDKRAAELESELATEIEQLNKLARQQDLGQLSLIAQIDIVDFTIQDYDEVADADINVSGVVQKQQELQRITDKSKKLGNWRTGTMAVNTATNIAGAVIAGGNRVSGDLKTQIDECLIAVKTLSNVRVQAHISKSATDAELVWAEKIIAICEEWDTVDIDSINNKSAGATVSGGVGAGLGLVGTVTSAVANSRRVREGDEGTEKSLNTAANVLAGGTTVASGVAVVFNATQIGAIKRALDVAENCERELK